MSGYKATLLPAIAAILCMLPVGTAQQPPKVDLDSMDMEDLMNIKVTSVSKREQNLSRTPAAVFVIRQDDIRRSGATSIPDLLRMVPGLEVAQINTDTWAITSRGFNGQFSNKLLVLIDGRTVYDPTFSGIYWEVQDTTLEDIDRIEVIRGPGATIWGSNAVNGVINITTKASKDTQGALLTSEVGSGEQSAGARYGGTIGSGGQFRVFGKYSNRTSSADMASQGLADGYHFDRGGFRIDWAATGRDSTTLEGDFYSGKSNEPFNPPVVLGGHLPGFTVNTESAGGDVLARWTHTFAGGSELTLQTYFDRLSRVDSADPELRTTVDFDLRDHLTLGRHELVWGLGYRNNWDRLSGSPIVSFMPKTFQGSVYNSFAQDEMTVVEDKLWFTLGGKLEHNVFTGVEIEPSASLMWAANDRNGLWVSVARATRIPARNDTDISYRLSSFTTPDGAPALVTAFGNPQYQSEKLTAFEAGYRVAPVNRLWFDLTAFRNNYSDLRTIDAGVPTFVTAAPIPYLLVPLIYGNRMFGHTDGAEGSVEWKAASRWTLRGGYTWFLPSLRLDPSSTDTALLPENQGNAPRNQFQIGSLLNLPHLLEFDLTLYRIGRLSTGDIPGYTRLDARLGWPVTKHLDLSIVGQNLLTPSHLEFTEQEQKVLSTRIDRSLHAGLTWHF